MSYKIEPLPDSYAEVGKGPQWDPVSQSVYYVDVDTGKLLRYDYKQNKTYKCKLEGENLVAFIVPIEGSPNEFAVGCLRRALIVNWDGVSETCKIVRTLFEVQPGDKFKNNRFNDGKTDPCGRLIAGTMKYGGNEFEERLGELYSYSKGGKVKVLKTDVGISNGVAFDARAKKLYYVDTADFEVKAFDYDFATGAATNSKVISNFRKPDPKDNLFPDGMTIDTNGNIYVTTFNGYTIYKIQPSTGKILQEIKFPCMRITAASFGGPNLDILYVTTSSRGGLPEPAGSTFKVTGLGAKGCPIVKLQI